VGGRAASLGEGCREPSVLGGRPGFSDGEEEDVGKLLGDVVDGEELVFMGHEVIKDTGETIQEEKEQKGGQQKSDE
jgi:hypothetical protein